MRALEDAERFDLGVEFGGSAHEGHSIELTRDGALEAIFGTEDRQQAESLLSQSLFVLAPAEAGDGGGSQDQRPFSLSVIRDIAPRDAIERMLAVQMVATHVAVVRSARSLANSTNAKQQEAHTTGYAKLARTFAAQIEALQKHRRGGKQTVVVQHVTVADGGQAIVGHVETGPRDRGVGGS